MDIGPCQLNMLGDESIDFNFRCIRKVRCMTILISIVVQVLRYTFMILIVVLRRTVLVLGSSWLNKNCRLHRWNILIAEMLTVAAQEKRIYDLKKKNQELEKFKFVLDYKIKELKKQIEPREKDIKQMREQIAEVVSLSRCNINLSILICNH